MAFEDLGKCITRPAASNLSTSQYCFVNLDSASRVALSSDGGDAIGILQNDPAAIDYEAEVCISGISKVKTGGSFSVGDELSSDSTGRATVSITSDRILGRAVEASTGANQIVACLLGKQLSAQQVSILSV